MSLRLTPCIPTAAITLYTSYHATPEPDAPQQSRRHNTSGLRSPVPLLA
jgi:hypothetical protein